MQRRPISDRVDWAGAQDWDRSLFDALMPLPHGTSYNSYLIRGSQKVALLETVDPTKFEDLLEQLADVPRLDYIVAHHAEQDHTGSLPWVMERYPEARVICSPKCKDMLLDLLPLDADRIDVVEDGDTLSLGDRTLRFFHTPWVHWPETMVSLLEEEGILFSCDFFGSHVAGADLYARNLPLVEDAAKRYYAEIMMPYAKFIKKNLDKLAEVDFKIIAPSHGPVYDNPKFILDLYHDWVSGPCHNKVVLPFVSMHGSVRHMVEHLAGALTRQGVEVALLDLTVTSGDALALHLVDAATIVVGASSLLGGPHPLIAYAATIANALKPKTQFCAMVGSYGWSKKGMDDAGALLAGLKLDTLPGVACKGAPREEAYHALEELADAIVAKHREAGLM